MDVEKSSGFSACEKKKRDVKVCVCVCLHRAAGWTAAHKLPAEAFYFIFLHGQFFNQTGLPVEKDLCHFFVEILQNKNVYIYLLLLCYVIIFCRASVYIFTWTCRHSFSPSGTVNGW